MRYLFKYPFMDKILSVKDYFLTLLLSTPQFAKSHNCLLLIRNIRFIYIAIRCYKIKIYSIFCTLYQLLQIFSLISLYHHLKYHDIFQIPYQIFYIDRTCMEKISILATEYICKKANISKLHNK